MAAETHRDARDICNTWYFWLAEAILKAWPELELNAAQTRDISKGVKAFLEAVGRSATFERALGLPLAHVRDHAAYLRHCWGEPISAKSARAAIKNLAGIVVYLCRLHEAGRETLEGARIARLFYEEYHQFAVARGLGPPALEARDPLLGDLPSPREWLQAQRAR